MFEEAELDEAKDASEGNSPSNDNNMDTSSELPASTHKPVEIPETITEEPAQPFLTESEILKLTVTQLNAELTEVGLKPQGLKLDLQAQLRSYFSGFQTPKDKPGNTQHAKSNPNKRKKGPKTKGQASKKNKKQDSVSLGLLEELLGLIETCGTKIGNLIFYLRRLWERNPTARVIVFSQFSSVLQEVGEILERNNIGSTFVQGNVKMRRKAIDSFRSNTDVKVILLGTEKAGSGTHLVEADHIVLLDPVSGSKEEVQSVEAQAIARAVRQGQTNQVTLVRFIIRDTVEHSNYVKNYLGGDESLFRSKQQDLGLVRKAISEVNRPLVLKKAASAMRPLVKAASIGNLLANTPLKRTGDVTQLIEGSVDGEYQAENNQESTQQL